MLINDIKPNKAGTDKEGHINNIVSMSMGVTRRQKAYIHKLKVAEKINSKSEWIRDAIDFYTLFFEKIIIIQGQDVEPNSMKCSYTVAVQEVSE